MWDDARREKEKKALARFFEGPEAEARHQAHTLEEDQTAVWLAGQPGVEAKRITSFIPEQWEGSVDGHSFFFRERSGLWRIELDLELTGDFAERLVDVGEGGQLVTEPVPMRGGRIIGEGIDSQLGESWIDHISFIVRSIRDYLWAEECDHSEALLFCPKCGKRM